MTQQREHSETRAELPEQPANAAGSAHHGRTTEHWRAILFGVLAPCAIVLICLAAVWLSVWAAVWIDHAIASLPVPPHPKG